MGGADARVDDVDGDSLTGAAKAVGPCQRQRRLVDAVESPRCRDLRVRRMDDLVGLDGHHRRISEQQLSLSEGARHRKPVQQ